MAELPVWRAALTDSSHPMYSIAWYLFREKFNAARVAEKYADRRDEILPFLYAILDEDSLHHEGSLGDGYAPINAVNLIGAWQVVDAIPRLLAYLDNDEYDDDTFISDRAAFALERMPPEAIEPLLEYGQLGEDQAMTAMFILTRVGKGDDRCFAFICSVFERATTELDITTIADCLAANNLDKAEAYLREKSQHGRYRRYRSDFEKIIESNRRDDWVESGGNL